MFKQVSTRQIKFVQDDHLHPVLNQLELMQRLVVIFPEDNCCMLAIKPDWNCIY
jgi:hypothetical protein